MKRWGLAALVVACALVLWAEPLFAGSMMGGYGGGYSGGVMMSGQGYSYGGGYMSVRYGPGGYMMGGYGGPYYGHPYNGYIPPRMVRPIVVPPQPPRVRPMPFIRRPFR